MEYLRSLKKPAMEEGSRREVESAHTAVEEFNSVEEQEVVVAGRGIPKREDKASEKDSSGLTSKGLIWAGLNSSSDTGSNNEVIHIVTSGGVTSQPCSRLPKRIPKESCSEDRFNSGSRQALECRNLSCDCKTVTC